MTGTGKSFLPSPRRISNRGLINKLKEWGWHEGKNEGDDVWMVSPRGNEVRVRRADIHKINSDDQINAVLHVMNMTWEDFVLPHPEDVRNAAKVISSMNPDEVDEYAGAMVRTFAAQDELQSAIDHARMEQVKAQRRERRRKPKETAVQPAPKQEPQPTTPRLVVVDAPKRNRGTYQRVWDVLSNQPQGISLDGLVRALDGSNDARSSINGACTRYVDRGFVERLGRGVYRVKPEYAHTDVRVDVVARSEQSVQVDAPPAKPNPTEVFTDAMSGAAPMQEDTINDLLDLMFPNGFKAKHLPLIDRWRQVTAALIREIEEG